MNIRIGKISQFISPGYSFCGACKTTWNFVEGHSTKYNEFNGCFPLCEKCWKEMTIEQRLPFYKELWTNWNQCGTSNAFWEDIENAVLAGK